MMYTTAHLKLCHRRRGEACEEGCRVHHSHTYYLTCLYLLQGLRTCLDPESAAEVLILGPHC